MRRCAGRQQADCTHCGFEEIYKLTSKKESKTKLRAGVYCWRAEAIHGHCRHGVIVARLAFKDFNGDFHSLFLEKIHQRVATFADAENDLSHCMVLTHRIRHAMATDLKMAKPLQTTVETDETFCKNFRAMRDKKGKPQSLTTINIFTN